VVDTLGIDPGLELCRLHGRLLNHELPPLAETPEPVAPAARPIAPAQLPAAVPSLAGRDRELAWLDDLIRRADAGESAAGVVTGSAGIGKSALVVAWANRVAARFSDGVLFAALRGSTRITRRSSPRTVLTRFLLDLGVQTVEVPEQMHQRVALYRSLIARSRLLVLLDDASTAEQVRPLLPPGSRSFAVVTSRSRLTGLSSLTRPGCGC
jgi:hypothetical protein